MRYQTKANWFFREIRFNFAIKCLLILQLGVFLWPLLAYAGNITDENVISLVNAERRSAGLTDLTANQLLTRAASLKAEAIISAQTFQHDLGGRKFSAWVKDAGYDYSFIGENLAISFRTGEGTVRAWMDSPTHKKNILNNTFTETGVAVLTGEFDGETTTVVVQIFGAPAALSAIRSGSPTQATASPVRETLVPELSETMVYPEKTQTAIPNTVAETVPALRPLQNDYRVAEDISRSEYLWHARTGALTGSAVAAMPVSAFNNTAASLTEKPAAIAKSFGSTLSAFPALPMISLYTDIQDTSVIFISLCLMTLSIMYLCVRLLMPTTETNS